ncbi:hypothetical protein ACWGJ9_07310 [Curtobacterium citreum]
MTEPIDIAGGGLDSCSEGVTRQGMYEPCEATAVAVRLDPEEHTPYPVCARHARGEMVPLHDVLQPAVQDVDTLRKLRAAHAEWQRTGDLYEFVRASTTLLGT